MKKVIKKSAGGKVSGTLLALAEGGKKATTGAVSKKAVALLTLLLAIAAMVGAEPKTGTILSEANKDISGASGIVYYRYMVDSTGNSFANRQLIADKDGINKPNIVFDTLTKYLVPGQKICI
jgi:hypothetical protein